MMPVEIMFNTSLVAVPAFMRVDPVMTSGPVTGVMAMSTILVTGEPATQQRPMRSAPSERA